MTIKDTIEIFSWLKKYWEKRTTLLVLLALILASGLYLAYQFNIEEASKNITQSEVAIIALAMIGVSVLWYFSRKLPKTQHGKIGIAIAIDCETKKERQRLKEDFVRALADEIASGSHLHFQLLELSEYQASKINDQNAAQYQRKIGAHLLIYGQCRIRQHQSQPTYVLKLNASVLHLEIPIEVSRSLGLDMRVAFPAQTIIPESDELLGFQVTKDAVRIAAKFSLGAASLLSRDAVTAFDLHHGIWLETKDAIELEGPIAESIRLIKNRLPKLLVQEGLHAAHLYYIKKPADYLDKMKNYIDVVQEIDPRNYQAHLSRGIYYFLHSHDIEKAKKEIRKAKNKRDNTWECNEAFLAAYEGDLEQAHKSYKRAFHGLIESATVLNIEVFIHDILEREPDKIQFWYCLGMINYFFKKDSLAAKHDFAKFIELASKENRFATSIDFAKQYLAELDNSSETPEA